MKLSLTVPRKGSTGDYAALKVAEYINECGNQDADIIIKTDQEPAIKYLVDDIKKHRTGAKIISEDAPKSSKGSNGTVERAVQTIEGMIRTLKSAVDERYMVRISAEHLIITWLVDYAAFLVNRLEVGRDGKTSYERSRGKSATVLGVEFAERVLWKERTTGPMQKINARWQYGVFIGVRRRSGEIYVVYH